MRALLVTTAGICVSIGVGVGVVDATSSSPSPAAFTVATAFANTLQSGSARLTVGLGASAPSGVTSSVASGRGVVDFASGASSLTLELGGATATRVGLDEIDVGGNLYLHIPQLSLRFPRIEWIEVPVHATGSAPSGQSRVNASMALLRLLEQPGNSVTSAETMTVGGEALHEYSVTLRPAPVNEVPGSALIPERVRRAILAALADRAALALTVWINPADRVVRIAGDTTMSLPGSVGASVRFALDLGDFGASPAVSPPVSGVVSLRELLKLEKVLGKL